MTDVGAVVPMIDYLRIIGMAMVPVWELKGTILAYGFTSDIPRWTLYILAEIGCAIPVPFILVFIKAIIHKMSKSNVKFFNRFSNWLLGKVEKNRAKIDKFGYWALFAFVAIPLPGTGVWTGSLLGAMMDMKIKKALPVVLLGNVVAGLAVLAIVFGVDHLF